MGVASGKLGTVGCRKRAIYSPPPDPTTTNGCLDQTPPTPVSSSARGWKKATAPPPRERALLSPFSSLSSPFARFSPRANAVKVTLYLSPLLKYHQLFLPLSLGENSNCLLHFFSIQVIVDCFEFRAQQASVFFANLS